MLVRLDRQSATDERPPAVVGDLGLRNLLLSESRDVRLEVQIAVLPQGLHYVGRLREDAGGGFRDPILRNRRLLALQDLEADRRQEYGNSTGPLLQLGERSTFDGPHNRQRLACLRPVVIAVQRTHDDWPRVEDLPEV